MRTGAEDRLTAGLARIAGRPGPGLVGIGDDAAVIPWRGKDRLVLTTDTLVEGIDFHRGESGFWIGRRAAAANLSDLAAMAARPAGFLLTVGLPRRAGADDARAVARGAISRMKSAGAGLWGGDLTRSRELFVTIAAVGRSSRPVLRSGARPGDLIFITGEPGRSREARLRRANRVGRRAAARELPFLDPPDRLEFALAAGKERLIRAMIDISDGIGRDAARLAAASGVGIELSGIPLSWIRSSGDDFELLLAAPPASVRALGRIAKSTGTPLRQAGRAVAGRSVVWTDRGRRVPVGTVGYDHLER